MLLLCRNPADDFGVRPSIAGNEDVKRNICLGQMVPLVALEAWLVLLPCCSWSRSSHGCGCNHGCRSPDRCSGMVDIINKNLIRVLFLKYLIIETNCNC